MVHVERNYDQASDWEYVRISFIAGIVDLWEVACGNENRYEKLIELNPGLGNPRRIKSPVFIIMKKSWHKEDNKRQREIERNRPVQFRFEC